MVLKVVKETLATMSLSDKIGQMSQVELGLVVQDDPQNPGHKIVDHVGSSHICSLIGTRLALSVHSYLFACFTG